MGRDYSGLGWNRIADEPDEIIETTRFSLAAPDVAYEGLRSYGQAMQGRGRLSNTEMERALYQRADKLITLGLAEFASAHDLLYEIFQKAKQGTGDAAYDEAVRLAVLSNRVATASAFMESTFRDEFRRLCAEGSPEELRALLQHPARSDLIADIYRKDGALGDLDDARWMTLVAYTVDNEGVLQDEEAHLRVARAAVDLLHKAPSDIQWVPLLKRLLIWLDPTEICAASKAAALETLERWRPDKLHGVSAKTRKQRGTWTERPVVEEFHLLVSMACSRFYEDDRIQYLGSLDAPDLALRCAYYGHASLSLDEIQAAHERDGTAFLLPAVYNYDLMGNLPKRLALYELVQGTDMDELFESRRRLFDARRRPGFTWPPRDGEEEPSAEEQQSKLEEERFEVLARSLNGLEARTASLRVVNLVGLAVIVVLLLVK